MDVGCGQQGFINRNNLIKLMDASCGQQGIFNCNNLMDASWHHMATNSAY